MAEFMPPDGDGSSLLTQADQGRVQEVSETTVFKGQFGLVSLGGMGKKLKNICFTDVQAKILQ